MDVTQVDVLLPPVTSSTPEKKRVVTKPTEFFQLFRESNLYKQAHDTFFTGKNFAPDVTEEEKRSAFETSPSIRSIIVNFYQKDTELRYDHNEYPPDVQKAINEYRGAARDHRKISRSNEIFPHALERADEIRAMAHIHVGSLLAEHKIVPDVRFGKIIANLFLLPEGLTSYDNLLESDVSRAQRMI